MIKIFLAYILPLDLESALEEHKVRSTYVVFQSEQI